MKSAVPRRNSLRLPPQPPHIPVPPSLKQSPYLNAPLFKREIPSPRLPSEEDERWLQDTIPVSSTTSKATSRQPSSEPLSPVESTPSSPSSALSRAQSQIAKYLAHSLAPPPPPSFDSRPAQLCQARSESDILRLRQPNSDPVYMR